MPLPPYKIGSQNSPYKLGLMISKNNSDKKFVHHELIFLAITITPFIINCFCNSEKVSCYTTHLLTSQIEKKSSPYQLPHMVIIERKLYIEVNERQSYLFNNLVY